MHDFSWVTVVMDLASCFGQALAGVFVEMDLLYLVARYVPVYKNVDKYQKSHLGRSYVIRGVGR